jgi:hypothetical protein
VGDAIAKAAPDFFKHRVAPAIFDHVVQEGSDGLVFASAGFEHKRGDTHQMRDVGDVGSLAFLASVFFSRVEERFVKAWAKLRGTVGNTHDRSPRRIFRYA